MSNILDTRELQERLEELENLESDYKLAKEDLEEATKALEDYRANDQKNNSDVEQEEKIIELEQELEDAENHVEELEIDSEDKIELETLRELAEEIGSEWKHGVQLIPECDFVDYCEELCKELGDIPKDLPHYIVIDWAKTASYIQQDYSETIYNGETYLYRA